MFTTEGLDALVAALEEADVRADLDPAKVNTPGAWVTLDGFQAVNVRRDPMVDAVVYLIVADLDTRRALDALAELYNKVVPTVLRPDGRVIAQGVILPDSSTPLPALKVPVRL